MTHAERAARRVEIRAAVGAGEAASAVALRFGVSVSSVYTVAAGLARARELDVNTYLVIAALCRAGATCAGVGRELGVSRQLVHQVLVRCREAGVPVRVVDGREAG